jgi:hypothetical protein
VKQQSRGGSPKAATLSASPTFKNSPVHWNPRPNGEGWRRLLAAFVPVFTAPGFVIFPELVTAWVVCPARGTVSGMMRGGGLVAKRPHDAYHRLVRAASWSLGEFWSLTALLLVRLFAPEGRIDLLTDDPLLHRPGTKIEGVGVFRDAVRPGGKSTVFDRGLNLVPLTLRVRPPWGGEPLALPLAMRLYRKHGPTHRALVAQMVQRLAALVPDRTFHLIADGAYAPLAGWGLPRTEVTSRMRQDAALYALPPPRRTGQVGRPRKKGRRLLCPKTWAHRTKTGWKRTWVDRRGRLVQRLLLTRDALGHHVCPNQPMRVVVSRDPVGREKDDVFFTTDLTMAPGAVVSHSFGRWPVEGTFRNCKQSLGAEEPQTWKGMGPERAASLAFWPYSMIRVWYLRTQGPTPKVPRLRWYPKKVRPSFVDAVGALRGELWREGISSRGGRTPPLGEITRPLVEVLALSR